MKSIDAQPPKSARRWFRFSLRSLMLHMVVIAIPMAWKVNRARNQRAVVAELGKLNSQIMYDYQIVNGRANRNLSPPGPKWLIDFLGKEYFVEVSQVTLRNLHVTNDTLALVARLPEVKSASCGSASGITDSGLVHLAGMHDLEEVFLYPKRITGAGLVHLTGLKRLKKLYVPGWITDVSLEDVSKLEHLEHLHISGATQITDRGLVHIAKLRNLRYLVIGSLGTDGLGERDCMKYTDEGLVNLYGLKNLGFLRLSINEVSQASRDKLQAALPNCQIEWYLNGPNDSDAVDSDAAVSAERTEE